MILTTLNFAGKVVNDAAAYVNKFTPRILTARHNVTALGYKSLEPPRSTSLLSSLRLADHIHHQDCLHATMNIDPLSNFTTSSASLVVYAIDRRTGGGDQRDQGHRRNR
jgi:hypothetical protein